MARKPDTPCADCGALMWSGPTSLPAGKARCLPCRRARPTIGLPRVDPLRICERCGSEFHGRKHRRFCSLTCTARALGQERQVRADSDTRLERHRREWSSPGLSWRQRSALLRRWRSQRRACTYCPALADTMDHVVPLVRGGTNYEGNLTPCCRRCNGSKSGRLIVEWRTGRRLPRMASPLKEKVTKERTPVVVAAPKSCPVCSSEHHKRAACCSRQCQAEHQARKVRDAYRQKRGLPVDPRRPTKSFGLRNVRPVILASGTPVDLAPDRKPPPA